jgi:NDP-mannose synthase
MDYGVISVEHGDRGDRVVGYLEKPEITSIVSMGVYVLEPHVIEHIPHGRHFDFPDLVHALLRADQPVGSYEYDGSWFDIGRHDDYERAVIAWQNGSLVPGRRHATDRPAVEHRQGA